MEIQTLQPERLQVLCLLGGLMVVLWLARASSRRAMRSFATPDRLSHILPRTGQLRTVLSTVWILLSMGLIVVALIDIRWGKTIRDVPQKGMEIVFALDVSRSMMAEDTAPNRLERAKQDMVDVINEMQGDRIGLIIFAGEAKRYLPMTSHYEDFKLALAEVGPHLLSIGGTDLGQALELAAKTFLDQSTDHKAIVLFTDGEDHESQALEVAKRIHAEQGIRIFTVGLGDAAQGSLIPDPRRGSSETYLKHGGEWVRSKMDSQLLEQIATQTSGAWIPAGTKQVDMGSVYRNYIDGVDTKEFETRSIEVYTPRYPWFLGLAVVLLFVEVLTSSPSNMWDLDETRLAPNRMTSGTSSSTEPAEPTEPTERKSLAQAAGCHLVLMSSLLLASGGIATDDVVRLADQARTALQDNDADRAIELLDEALAKQDDLRLVFNKGVAHFQKGDFESARQMFARAAGSTDAGLAAQARYNLGHTEYSEGLKLLEGDLSEDEDKDHAAAREKLVSALGHFRATLKANPSDEDARANLELAHRLLKRLTPQDQTPPEPQPNQRLGEDQDQNQEKQDPQQNEEKPSDQDEQQDPANENQDHNEGADGQDDQDQQDKQDSSSQSDQETNEDESESSSQSDSESSEDAGASEKTDEADSNPQQDQNQKQNQNQMDHGEKQDEPSSSQESSDPRDGNPQDNSQMPPHPSAQSSGNPPAMEPPRRQEITQQEAEKMLQAVRDREFRRRLMQQQRMQSRRIPVERDW